MVKIWSKYGQSLALASQNLTRREKEEKQVTFKRGLEIEKTNKQQINRSNRRFCTDKDVKSCNKPKTT
jgi:hypothetical protein